MSPHYMPVVPLLPLHGHDVELVIHHTTQCVESGSFHRILVISQHCML